MRLYSGSGSLPGTKSRAFCLFRLLRNSRLWAPQGCVHGCASACASQGEFPTSCSASLSSPGRGPLRAPAPGCPIPDFQASARDTWPHTPESRGSGKGPLRASAHVPWGPPGHNRLRLCRGLHLAAWPSQASEEGRRTLFPSLPPPCPAAPRHLEQAWCQLRCAVSARSTLDVKDLEIQRR